MVQVLFASITFFFLSLGFFIPAGPVFGRGGECMYTCHSGLNVVGVIGKRLSFSGWVLETQLKSSGLAANFFVLLAPGSFLKISIYTGLRNHNRWREQVKLKAYSG